MIKKILHTSDWHIGRRLKNRERHEEFKEFFAWLENLIKTENIDALLVAGDIFDNTTPGNKAQDIYYSFLSRIAKSSCRHVVIISGNHDSPAFLDAPKDLLKIFKIHVIGGACEKTADEVITLYDDLGEPELIVCAVPYLRERDVMTLKNNDGDNIENSLIKGIKNHYEKVFAEALKLKSKNSNIPVIAMGHLFARGGKVNDGDGVRSLYIGTAVEIGADIFPDFLTYTALGHLHSPQKISRDNIRYSGSPLIMDFGEISSRKKAVNILELDSENLIDIKEIHVPVFQRLERIKGNFDEISSELDSLGRENESIWLDITYTGKETAGDLQEKISESLKKFPLLEVLSLRDEGERIGVIVDGGIPSEHIEDFTPLKMFEICLDANKTPDSQQKVFMPMYKEILQNLEIDF